MVWKILSKVVLLVEKHRAHGPLTLQEPQAPSQSAGVVLHCYHPIPHIMLNMPQRTAVLLFLLFCAMAARAQWSSDPADPLVICDADGYQQRPEVISDGSSGWYIFWSDRRNDSYVEVYGQRVNSDGMALWEPNGKLIVSAPDSNIYFKYPLLMEDGSVMLAYSVSGTGADNLNVARFDQNGESLWAGPVRLASKGPGPLGNLRKFKLITGIRNGSEAVFAWMYALDVELVGPYAFERVALDGTTHFGQPGMGISNSGKGQMNIFNDTSGGFIFHWQATGSSQYPPLFAMRVNEEGVPAWSQNMDLTQGSNVAVGFSTAHDDAGNFYTAWGDANDNIRLTATNPSGQFTWTPNATIACNQPDAQYYARTLLHDQQLFVAWSDMRAPANNLDLYMQGFSLDGQALWAANGIPIIQAVSDYPPPELIPSSNGSVIAVFPALAPGFLAMRVLPDGALAWTDPAQFCTSNFNPDGLNYRLFPDGQGGAVAFWQSITGDLYGARVDASGDVGVTSIEESEHASFEVYPNPTEGCLTIRTDQVIQRVEVWNALGALVLTTKDRILDLTGSGPGVYNVAVTAGGVCITQQVVLR